MVATSLLGVHTTHTTYAWQLTLTLVLLSQFDMDMLTLSKISLTNGSSKYMIKISCYTS